MKSIAFIALLFIVNRTFCQINKSTLQIEEIMKGKDFIGYWPENIAWHLDGTKILFDWNPENTTKMVRYEYHIQTKKISKTSPDNPVSELEFDPTQKMFMEQYFEFNGHLWSYNKSTKISKKIISSTTRIFNIQRLNNENRIAFQQDINLFIYDSKLGTVEQITFFEKENGVTQKNANKRNDPLITQQKELFLFLKEKNQQKIDSKTATKLPKTYLLNDKHIDFLVLSPDEKYVYTGFGVYLENKPTTIEHFITETGYTQSRSARPKVGENEPIHSLGILDLTKDSLVILSFDKLTNIRKKPTYLIEYTQDSKDYLENRKVCFHAPILSKEGKAIMDIRSYDNKDRWIIQLFPDRNDFEEMDNQHDEAWIGGPGISSWNQENGVLGFYSNGNKAFYQSEISGYSHLYSFDFSTKSKTQLTSGEFEIHDVTLSSDEQTFYISSNQSHPGNRNFYQFDSETKKTIGLLTEFGAYDVKISPNEKKLAFLYSNKTNPWELFLVENAENKNPQKITSSQTEKFKNYTWTNPEVITFKGKDEVHVYARLFEAQETKNKSAVIFVHGAGYLQNAHNYWSQYFREFMFHNLLKDNGITVLDIDYRASEGYGRAYRTAIYRHMGSMDLEDQISGKKYLVDSLGIQPKKVGIYGGSYGGFITLMALLTRPEEFACGAALRSVTDWLHYNHEYTSNILNYPSTDSIAYHRSSPINFAEGLAKPLIMFHGMVDDNVQFQDIVRLSERFIELGKTNWELAVYPMETHSFKNSYSWTDEYRRIYKLFNKELLTE